MFRKNNLICNQYMKIDYKGLIYEHDKNGVQ